MVRLIGVEGLVNVLFAESLLRTDQSKGRGLPRRCDMSEALPPRYPNARALSRMMGIPRSVEVPYNEGVGYRSGPFRKAVIHLGI